jgi:hypothetical protein
VFGRRKTPTERTRQRVELAESIRRFHSGEEAQADARRRVSRAASEYRNALREVERAANLPDPAPELEPPACEKHPAWSPPRRLAGQPRPPAGMCPRCTAEQARKPTGPAVLITGGGSLYPSPQPRGRLAELWADHLEGRLENGELVPGSDAEKAVLDYMDDKRKKTLRHERGYRKPWRPRGDGTIITVEGEEGE